MKIVKRIVYVIIALLVVGLAGLFYLGDTQNTGERNAVALLKDKILDNQKEPVSLIICWSPLQMLIAEKIMEQNPQEKFHIILMSYVKNEKFEYYFKRLKNKAERAYSFYTIEPWENKHLVYTTLLELKLKSELLPELKTIYLSNVDKTEIHTILSSHPEAEIKTFDDGTAHLVFNTHLLRDEEAVKNKFYKTFINSTQTPKTIRERSAEHFTIFRDLPNIMEKDAKKMTYLPLFEHQNETKQEVKDTIKIMLGTLETELKKTSELAIKKLGIDYATLHPRQEYVLDDVETIQTELIIEDYLLQELAKNPHTQYEIYTFFSSAALTIKDFPRVKVIALKPTSLPKNYRYSPIYNLFEKSGIPILEIKDK